MLARRALWLPPTLAGLLVIVFAISHVVPTDPVRVLAGENASPAQIEALRVQLGYDQPLPVRFLRHLGDLARGDMGRSLYTQRPIAEDLAGRLPATLELTAAAILLAILIGVPAGVFAALGRNGWFDHALRVATVSGLAVASFWLAMELQFLFAMTWRLTPLNGRFDGFPPDPTTGFLVVDTLLAGDLEGLGTALRHLALPTVTLALPAAATITRFTRAGVLDAIGAPAVLYQRAMGLPERLIVWKYVLRAAMTSTVTQIGLIFGVLVSGAVVVEAVYDWPGLGTYAVASILQSDHRAIMGFTLWVGAMVVLVNLLVDIVQSFLDPRG